MKNRLIPLLLKLFPAFWITEYGKEFEDLLRRTPLSTADVADVVLSAFKERARDPILKFCIAIGITALALFASALTFARQTWRLLSDPALLVLRHHRISPPMLVSDTPYEQLGVVWLGIPLLFTLLLIYPCVPAFASVFFRQRWTRSFALCSGMASVFSLASGFLLWRQGAPLSLLLVLGSANPSYLLSPVLSVGRFFLLLVLTTLLWTAIFQIPVILIFARHRNTSLH